MSKFILLCVCLCLAFTASSQKFTFDLEHTQELPKLLINEGYDTLAIVSIHQLDAYNWYQRQYRDYIVLADKYDIEVANNEYLLETNSSLVNSVDDMSFSQKLLIRNEDQNLVEVKRIADNVQQITKQVIEDMNSSNKYKDFAIVCLSTAVGTLVGENYFNRPLAGAGIGFASGLGIKLML